MNIFRLFTKDRTAQRKQNRNIVYQRNGSVTVVSIPPVYPNGLQRHELNEVATYDFPQTLEREYVDAEKKFNRWNIEQEPLTRGGYKEQWSTVFDPDELALGISTIWEVDRNNFYGRQVDVPGAYVGRFAQILEKVGFRVRASDPVQDWVEYLKCIGLDAYRGIAQDLPGSKFATFMFELYPVTEGNWYLAFARETANSERGVVFVESKVSWIDDLARLIKAAREYQIGDLPDTNQAFLRFGTLYGLTYYVVDTNHLRFHGYREIHETSRTLLKRDLQLLNLLSDVIPERERHSDPGAIRLHLAQLAAELGCRIEEVCHSINRPLYAIRGVTKFGVLQPFDESERRFYLYKRDEHGKLIE